MNDSPGVLFSMPDKQLRTTTVQMYWPAVLFNVGLGLYVYRKWGAGALCVVGVIEHFVILILKRSVALAKQRVESSAQSSNATHASSAERPQRST